jgi:hypothetical protein
MFGMLRIRDGRQKLLEAVYAATCKSQNEYVAGTRMRRQIRGLVLTRTIRNCNTCRVDAGALRRRAVRITGILLAIVGG